MDCACFTDESSNGPLQKLLDMEQELVDVARKVLKSAGDPISGVIRFLHERPENTSLPGQLVNRVLLGAFGDREQIPALVKLLSAHVREIARSSNVISIVNEHPAVEKFGQYVIKQKEKIAFEVAKEKDKTLLKNIVGLVAVEHGMDLPLEKILVQPPNLIVTVKLGLFPAQRTLEI